MPRICAREDCGRRLLRKNGAPDYHRHFCGTECKNADERERMQANRNQVKRGKCPLCGQRSQRLTPDSPVPRHKAL
jgi:endogenous inhibitor of DNA gyrase (YacG/DUF329 family)